MASDNGNTNGFVERPERVKGPRVLGELMRRLIATADNGKAIPWDRGSTVGGQRIKYLKERGFKAHVNKIEAGAYVAWCERITPEGEARGPQC